MTLPSGTRLGPYEVLSILGAGGMGEVYRARDTRLDRMVAVKVLAPELAADDEFRARFTREAKAISALNHAHICSLYDVGREDGADYLVLELLEGETLAARLTRGALPLAQVLRFGSEIADALEAAHRQGIVHRDLKPGNVMLTGAGTKLLDFGLAKHAERSVGPALSMLATAPGTATAQGAIVGTLQYMAPEQVQGQPADARTDVFALGTLLHEMATGRRAFEATSQASLTAKILETDPPVVSSLAPLASPAFDHVVRSCMAKAPADRWQSAHDVKLQLEWLQAQASAGEQARTRLPRKGAQWIPWTVAAGTLALAVTGPFLWPRPSMVPALPARFELVLPREMRFNALGIDRGAISPDGRHFAFTATVDGRSQLVTRAVGSTELAVLPGTNDVFNPFWSPDSQSIAFFDMGTGQIKSMSVTGGRTRVLADVGPIDYETGGTWAPGVLLFGQRDGRIYRVLDGGGSATVLDTLPRQAAPKRFVSPRFLPDGRHFTIRVLDEPGVYLASVDAHGLRKILDDASSVAYAEEHLCYTRADSLFARPFDVRRLEFSGPEVRVTAGAGRFSVSDRGTIVYQPARVPEWRLTWFDRQGRRTGTVGIPGPYTQMVLSPRGGRATVSRGDRVEGDLWDVDLASGIFSRLTTQPGLDSDPAWSPDERSLAFSSDRHGRQAVFVKDLVSGKEDQLVELEEPAVVDEWTLDGRYVIVRTMGQAVYSVSRHGDRTPRLLVATPYTEDELHVSPDGRWVAFNADESGRWEVYIAAFPTFTSKRQVSNGGGVQPQWRRDGRELFYLDLDGSVMSVRLDLGTGLAPSAPARLFPTNIGADPQTPQYAVTADGQRFLGLEPVGETANFTFLLNWLKDVSSPAARVR